MNENPGEEKKPNQVDQWKSELPSNASANISTPTPPKDESISDGPWVPSSEALQKMKDAAQGISRVERNDSFSLKSDFPGQKIVPKERPIAHQDNFFNVGLAERQKEWDDQKRPDASPDFIEKIKNIGGQAEEPLPEWKEDLIEHYENQSGANISIPITDPGTDPDALGPTHPEDTLSGQIISAKYGEEIHEHLREFRVSIDSLYLTAFEISNKPYYNSREMSLAVTALQSARQFCGKILQERGAPKPYTSEKTEQTDKGQVIKFITAHISPIDGTQELRERIQDVITDFSIYAENTQPVSWIEATCNMTVMQQLLSGKMWLGELFAKLINHKDAPEK